MRNGPKHVLGSCFSSLVRRKKQRNRKQQMHLHLFTHLGKRKTRNRKQEIHQTWASYLFINFSYIGCMHQVRFVYGY